MVLDTLSCSYQLLDLDMAEARVGFPVNNPGGVIKNDLLDGA